MSMENKIETKKVAEKLIWIAMTQILIKDLNNIRELETKKNVDLKS